MPEIYAPPSTRNEAYELIAENLFCTPELISSFGLTPLGSPKQADTAEQGYWSKLSTYLGPFFHAVQAAHIFAPKVLSEAGCNDDQIDSFIGGGFSAGTSVTAQFLGKAVEACCSANAVQHFGTPTPNSVAAILHRSYPTIAKFGATANNHNFALEKIYDIRPLAVGSSLIINGIKTSRLFSLQQAGDRPPRVVADDWKQSCIDVTRTADYESARKVLFENTKRCPALTILTPALYHWMVDFGCATEEIVPTIIQDELTAQPGNVLAKQ